jgi:hypothetical protein
MRRISIILAASLVLAGCAASDDRRGAAPPPTSSEAAADLTSVTVERVEDAAPPRAESRAELRHPESRRPAPVAARRSRIRSITEQAPMAKSSTARPRAGAGRFRQITE